MSITLTEYYDAELDRLARDIVAQTGLPYAEVRAQVEVFRNVVGVEQADGTVKFGIADPLTWPPGMLEPDG